MDSVKPTKSRFGITEVHRRLFGYLKPYRGQFLLALVCMVIFGASDGAVPFLVKKILDGVFSDHDKHLLYLLPVLLLAFAIGRAIADFGQEYLIGKVGHLIIRDIRAQVNSHMLTLSPGFFVRNASADLISRITSDVILVRALLTSTAAAILRDFVRIVALLIAALYLDPVLALIAFTAFPLGIYPVYKFGKRMRRLSKTGQDAIGALSNKLQESMSGNRVVKIFGREDYERARFDHENDLLTRTFIKTERIRAITGPVNEILAILGISGVILYGGLSVINGIRTQGDFIAFLLSVFLLYDPFKKLSRINNVVQQGLAGADRIFQVLDQRPEIQEPLTPVALSNARDVEFKNVSFSYGTEDQAVLSEISLKIPERARVAIVGFSGAGKSTLIDLIPRFIDPQAGKVLIGGVNVADLRLAELRSQIAYVGQHTFLFNDTIYNNIAYGKTGATSAEIEKAARAAYAYDFIKALPGGFDTVVGESGMSLSGGERQRVAIARAILKNAPILILDEATAALDNRAEREVQKALEALAENRTSIIIAHRLSTVQSADLIVVLEQGRIVERGTHQELLAKGGTYSRLHALQFAEKAQPLELS